MTKKEILKELNITGEVHKKSKHHLWMKAFEGYKAETKDYNISMDCGGCFTKVLNWLKS